MYCKLLYTFIYLKGYLVTKQNMIEEYINTNIGATLKVKDICQATNTTYPTVTKFINTHSTRFELVVRGTYRILPESTHNQTIESSSNSTFEW